MMTNQYDPEWFRTSENAAYWLGYNLDNPLLMAYYSKQVIITDFVFKGRPPAEYLEANADATYKI